MVIYSQSPSLTLCCQKLVFVFYNYLLETGMVCLQGRICSLREKILSHKSDQAIGVSLTFHSIPFLCPATKSGGVLCYTLRTFECLSVRLSVRRSVRPSAVEHSCPVHNFDTVRDNFTKLGTNVKHDQTTCRD